MTDAHHTYRPTESSAPAPAAQPPPPGWQPQATHPVANDPRHKSPALAAILSVLPGLGQVYLGLYVRGFVQVIVFASTIAVLSSHSLHGGEPLFGIFLSFFWFYSIIDAGRTASAYNSALAGWKPAEMPQDLRLPPVGGSLAGGVALAVLGLILLSNTLFDLPLYWIEDWWPLAPITVGAWLAWRGYQERLAQRAAPRAAGPEAPAPEPR